jgi:transposase
MSKRCPPPQPIPQPVSGPSPTAPEPVIIGIDVAKDHLVIAQLNHSHVQTIANTHEAIEAWLEGIPPSSWIALESTGRYSRLACQLAHLAGMKVYLLNALDVHHYAKAMGQRGKTDRLDAQVIAHYVAGQGVQLRPWQPTPVALEQLRSLMRCRSKIVKAGVQLKLSLQDTPALQDQAKRIAQQFKQTIRSIDAQLRAMVHDDPALSQGAARLQTIQGVGLACRFTTRMLWWRFRVLTRVQPTRARNKVFGVCLSEVIRRCASKCGCVPWQPVAAVALRRTMRRSGQEVYLLRQLMS